MLAIIFGLLGFITSQSELLGDSLIHGLEWMNIWFWILAIATLLVYLIIFVTAMSIGTSFGSSVSNSKIGIFFGSFLGLTTSAIIGIFIFIRIIVLILLSNFLIDNIDSSIDSLAMLSSKQIITFIAIFMILLVSKISYTKTTTTRKRNL